ncbi:MAG: K(+)-transporting ATPase subunit F [Acidobacteria bacterium]|nr:K(+)-transporting ATPase subunit F [Acidobacteriota bacterium]
MVRQQVGRLVGADMNLIALLLSIAAFVYLVYAMLRPEEF